MDPDRIPPSDRLRANDRLKHKYADEAPGYDGEMDFWERYIFGAQHRSWACSKAVGETLEVAIGTGLNLPHYAAGVRITGVDLSTEMLAVAEARAQALELQISLKEADAQDLPFEDRSFDTVVCTYALCSVPDEAVAVLEMRRVLKPGGRLILVDHVRSTIRPLLWLQRAYELLPGHEDDHLTRRPATHVIDGNFRIEEIGRLRAGIIERVVASRSG